MLIGLLQLGCDTVDLKFQWGRKNKGSIIFNPLPILQFIFGSDLQDSSRVLSQWGGTSNPTCSPDR